VPAGAFGQQWWNFERSGGETHFGVSSPHNSAPCQHLLISSFSPQSDGQVFKKTRFKMCICTNTKIHKDGAVRRLHGRGRLVTGLHLAERCYSGDELAAGAGDPGAASSFARGRQPAEDKLGAHFGQRSLQGWRQ